MISIPMNQDEFTKAKEIVKTSDQVISKLEDSANEGTFKTSQVDLHYKYNGMDVLCLTVLAKHGLAKFVSEDTIKQHLEELLKSV